MKANFISNTPQGKDFFEGKSQYLIASAIFESLSSSDKLPHIIGLEGEWGSGKSNVIKQLSVIPDFSKKYKLFTYDAWGHQEDLQRRSILEVLTTKLIKDKFLEGKGKVRLRNGEVKEDKWSSLLNFLLSNKTITTTKPIVSASSFAILMLLLVCVANVTSTISSDKFDDCDGWVYWIVLLVPYALGLILIGYFALRNHSWKFLTQWAVKDEAEKVTEEYVSSEEPSIQEFRNWMQAISDYIGKNEKKQKLVLVFDNMDRLSSDKVKQLWSSIYAFFAGEAFENIWVIIPYDENHLMEAFSENNEDGGDNFIKKTFSMIYRVAPPVISDYELLFNSYFEEAFGKHKDESRISQIFRVLHPNPNPRDVIYFLNQMVSLVKMWNDAIPLGDIALYVCRKTRKDRGKRALDTYLLSGDIFNDVKALFGDLEKTKISLTKLAYGLREDKLAQEVPMRNYLRAYFESNEILDINELVDNPHFITVQKAVINDAPQTLINKYISGLGKLDISKMSEEDRAEITHKWDYLTNIWKGNGIEKQEFGEEPKLLLTHCSGKNKKGVIEVIVQELQNYPDFKGEEYFVAMDDLSRFLVEQNIAFDFTQIEEVKVPANVFLDYLNVAKHNYLRYRLYTTSDELQNCLSDADLKSCKRPELVEYLVNDLRYSFKQLLGYCKDLIENEQVDKDNICTLLFYVSFILSKIEKQEISAVKHLPSAEVFNELYASVYDQQEYINKPGYLDFIFLSMILAAKQPEITDENIEKIARISAKYARFNDVFANLSSVYPCRQKLAGSIIRQNIKGNLTLKTKIEQLPVIHSVTALSWSDILNYFSLYVDDLTEKDRKEVRDDFATIVPCDIFPEIKDVDCKLVSLIVSLGRKCLESGEHRLFDSSGKVITGYWYNFVISFLGTSCWKNTDGFVLKELTKVFDIYCDNHDISLIDNDFVNFIFDKTEQEDINPIMNKVRNGFTAGNREASVAEFKKFVHYFPELTSEVPNKETFVQNFIEKAFVTDESCRILIFNYSHYYMPLINQSCQIAQRIIKFIVEHKDSEDTCGKLYPMLSKEVVESLKPKNEEEK